MIPEINWLDYGLSEIRRAIALAEAAIEEESRDVKRRFDAELPIRTGPNYSGGGYAEFQVELWSAKMLLPTILRRSLFISIFSLVEYRLDQLCQDMHRSLGLPSSPTNFADGEGRKDKGIHRSQAYLKNEASFDFPDQTKEWGELCWYNDLRNCLAHNGGVVPVKQQKKNWKRDKVEITGAWEVNLLPGFCEEAVEVSDRFFKTLSAAYGKHMAQPRSAP